MYSFTSVKLQAVFCKLTGIIMMAQVWYTILHGQCMSSSKDGPHSALHSRLVLDIGSNFGYYSLYAAAHGCRCLASFKVSAHASHISTPVHQRQWISASF